MARWSLKSVEREFKRLAEDKKIVKKGKDIASYANLSLALKLLEEKEKELNIDLLTLEEAFTCVCGEAIGLGYWPEDAKKFDKKYCSWEHGRLEKDR